MVLVDAATKCGLRPFWFCAAANVLSLLGLALVLLKSARLRASAGLVLAIVGSAALFPQIFAAGSGFAVLPDALLLTLLVFGVVEGRPGLACLTAFLFCLFRPDGVVFAIPLLATFVVSQRGEAAML